MCVHEELLAIPELDGLDPRQLDGFLRRTVEVGVAVSDGQRWLGLAVFAPARSVPVRAAHSIELAVNSA